MWFVIGSAVLVSVGRLLAPYADALRAPLETWLSDALGQPVSIERVEAAWPRWSPEIWLHGLSIGPADARLMRIERARLQLKLYNLVRPARNSFELVAFGLDLGLVQDESGRWGWRVDRGGRFAEGWEQLISAGDVLLRDLTIRIQPNGWKALLFEVPEASLSRRADRLRVALAARPAAGGAPLIARLVMEMPRSRLQRLQLHASARSLDLIKLIPPAAAGQDRMLASLETWLTWRRSDGLRMRIDGDFDVDREGAPERVRARLDARWSDRSEFRADLDAWRTTATGERLQVIDQLAFADGPAVRAIAANDVDLGFVHQMLAPWLQHLAAWPDRLSGTAQALTLAWRPDFSVRTAAGQIRDLDFETGRDQWGVAGLNAGLGRVGDALVVQPSGAPRLVLDGLFGEPVQLSGIAGRLRVRPGSVGFDALRLAHAEFDMTIDGRVERVAGKPFVDLLIQAPRVEPVSPRRWLPRRGLPPKTRGWLEDALVEVQSLSGSATLFGNPARWRRHAAPGEIGVQATFDGMTLAYARDWPPGEALHGRIGFLGDRMRGEIERGEVAGTTLSAPRVEIDDLRAAELELELASRAPDAAALARLAGALPLPAAREALAQMRWSGPATARAVLWYPVRHRQDWRLLGTVEFDGAGVELPSPGIAMRAISGSLPFTRNGLGPAELDGTMRDEPAGFVLEGRWQGGFEMQLDGRFPARGVVPASWLETLPRAFAGLRGQSRFRFRFDRRMPAADPSEEPVLALDVDSDLVGTGIDLPAPLNKREPAAWPLHVQIPLGSVGAPIRFDLDRRFHGVVLAGDGHWQLGMTLGREAAEPVLPVAETFIVEGRLESLALDRWIAVLGGENSRTGEAQNPVRPVQLGGWLDVQLGKLEVAGTGLGPVALDLTRRGDYWRLDADGPNVAGSVRFPASNAADPSLVFDFDRLYWPLPEPDIDDVWPAPPPPSELDPRRLPTVSAVIRDLRWGELEVGELRLTTHEDPEGLQIEQLSTRRDGLELIGSGAWNATGDGIPATSMRLRLAAQNLGSSLRQAGFNLGLEGGQASIELNGAWPGSPLDFRFQRIDGTLDIEIIDGILTEAGPGAGRLLGLVSLGAIPRRLRLDFSDVFGQGLAFDRIVGQFRLQSPIAITDELKVTAPSADVAIRGRTNLAEHTYDQVLTVRPGVSSTLPIIGLLAGGPVGAAAGAALDRIFSRPLKGISEIRYSVTGPWSDPRIEPLGDVPGEQQPDGGG